MGWGLGILGIVGISLGIYGYYGYCGYYGYFIFTQYTQYTQYTHNKAQCDRNDNRNKPFHTETFLLEEQMLQIKGFKFREEYRNAPLFSKCSFQEYTTIS